MRSTHLKVKNERKKERKRFNNIERKLNFSLLQNYYSKHINTHEWITYMIHGKDSQH